MARSSASGDGPSNSSTPIYKRWWVWAAVVLVIIVILSSQQREPVESSVSTVDTTVPPTAQTPAQAPEPSSSEQTTDQSAPSSDPNRFTAAEMGDQWPFKGIESGTVACEDGMYAVLHADNGITYALNGTAKTAARTGDKPYQMIDGIWKEDPLMPGAKISIGPILNAATSLCN